MLDTNKIIRALYYVLNLTWGIPLNIVGGIVALVMLGSGHAPLHHCGCWYFEVGKNWGGINFGLTFLCQKNASDSLKNHEFGHSIQNAVFGWFMPFVVTLPSVARYWTREIQARKGKELPPYDSVWYEAQATQLGDKLNVDALWKSNN